MKVSTEFFIKRKALLEYDRVTLDQNLISSLTAAVLTPRKFCNVVNDCNNCLTTVPQFHCKWCESIKRYSDGVDRYRQQWLDSKCNTQESVACERSDFLRNTTLTP
ncbi:plexin domain-containing protein 1-like isoform X1 [Leptotrombidium deliense]|uniref:Plexin domain-containing protein 1-like isoform X1 n=1 Tax=Leptotrombidium deliense TaxID=299467 RepID=A0A443RUD2_9ACAR|nr:plexin domain-containing protein 1-like isoform X1 [Leptotrombidium deliense]